MKIYVTKKVEQDVLKDLKCDCCGKSCIDDHKLNFEYAHLVASWGYYSHRDTEVWNCDLCEDCAVKIKEFIENLGGKISIGHFLLGLNRDKLEV